MAYKTNKYVHIDSPEHGVLRFRKTKGKLTVEDIADALRDMDDENPYAMIVRATQFNGYLGEDHLPSTAIVHDIVALENCPACQASLEKARNDLWESAYNHGIEVGKSMTHQTRQCVKPCNTA